jgi:hypothetical protein
MSSNTRNQILSFTGLHPGLHLLKRSPIRTSAEVVAAMNGVPKTDTSALATIDYHFMQTFSMPHQPCYPLPLWQDFGQMA